MLQFNKYPQATAQFMSFTNTPATTDYNYKLRPANPFKKGRTKKLAGVTKAKAVPTRAVKKAVNPIRSMQSTLAWNKIYADKVAAGWWPKSLTPRFKAYLEYVKAKAVTQKAENALNKAKASNQNILKCSYLVAEGMQSASNNSASTKASPKKRRRLRKK